MTSLDATFVEGLCLQALAVTLQHPAVAADQRIICTLLQVNKAWRTAVQQSAASLTDISFHKVITLNSINMVSCFARWLFNHLGLISHLSTRPKCTGSNESLAVAKEVIQHFTELGMQAFAAFAAVTPFAAAECHFRSLFRLRSYSSSVPPTAALLAALPAATLTRLELDQLDNSNWYLGLGQLTSLQQMTLNMPAVEMHRSATDGCFRAISSLKMLTKLDLHGVPTKCDTSMLPRQLQELDLHYQYDNPSMPDDDPALEGYDSVVDLQHLTRLRQLKVKAYELAAGSSVPCDLSCLDMSMYRGPAGAVSGLNGLKQVTSVMLNIQRMNSQHLAPFKQLTQLQRLALEFGTATDALEVANAWGELPLCSLSIWQWPFQTIPYSNIAQLMQRFGGLTALTKLDLFVANIGPENPEAARLAVCQHLSTLTSLQELALGIGLRRDFVEQDAQHLTALTTLTSLTLCVDGAGPYMDATTLCLSAVKLTNLKVLKVREDPDYVHNTASTAALPAIGRLTSLEVLCLPILPSEAAGRGLQLLTDLSSLRNLGGFQRAGEEAMIAGLLGQHQIKQKATRLLTMIVLDFKGQY